MRRYHCAVQLAYSILCALEAKSQGYSVSHTQYRLLVDRRRGAGMSTEGWVAIWAFLSAAVAEWAPGDSTVMGSQVVFEFGSYCVLEATTTTSQPIKLVWVTCILTRWYQWASTHLQFAIFTDCDTEVLASPHREKLEDLEFQSSFSTNCISLRHHRAWEWIVHKYSVIGTQVCNLVHVQVLLSGESSLFLPAHKHASGLPLECAGSW